MRRSMTLIELIFSMVIIAIAFTIFPKVLQISAKTSKNTLKEEALFGGMAWMGLIKNLPWDERNTLFDDYLITNGDTDYECATSFWGAPIYRKGGFVGSRNCKHHQHASSSLGGEANDNSVPDDVDDFDGISKTMHNDNGSRSYEMNATVSYKTDLALTDTTFSTTNATSTSNTKYIDIYVYSQARQGAFASKELAHIWYISANIGQIAINRAPWVH